ncbi:hypothetical protein [Streptomyces sp. NBC_00557]|uniref:hypothetical protein n=1 Tax=Streptomyces sp. NBC_00557 TaxID=2975776 RepID=UPI002E81FF42|nr:hypothetical protein [Streptomyces sp. NBC_00557]WUC35750.1 hypothetical protein OG956_16730 [Streptomyces sp. NBC_00557]
MTYPTVIGRTALPGVRLRLARLAHDLERGRSCLLLLPARLVDGPGSPSEDLLDDVLHELDDYVLLPPAGTGDAAPPTADAWLPSQRAAPDTARWSGLAPVLDYDDGLGDLFGSAPPTAPEPGAPPRPGSASPAPPPLQGGPGRQAGGPSEAEALAGLLERLAKEVNLQGDMADGDEEGDVLTRLVRCRNGEPEIRPVVVRGWRESAPSATGHLLRRMVAVTKEAGLPPGRGPRALVVATTDDLPPGLPGQLVREDVAVHWWWGVTGRLDTATVVALSRPPLDSSLAGRQLYEAVAQATITEICGPFLDIASSLAARWADGRPETLPDALREVIEAGPVPEAFLLSDQTLARGPGAHPDETLLPAWNAAAVESWDGRLRRHPAHFLDNEHAMASQVWLAQNHVLLPLLDASRERFADVVRANARLPLQRLAEQYGPRRDLDEGGVPTSTLIETMEVGAMWGAFRDGAIALTQRDRRHLRILRDARNRLAHRTPLDGEGLQTLIKELCR